MRCCSQTNGLGQIDPGTLLAINQAVVHAKDLWNDIKAIFGIGAGAKEADAITPLQNQIEQTVLAPIGAYLESVRNGTIEATCEECKTYYSQLTATETQWLNFLHNTQWADGRAAQQAEATLKPIFTSQKQELQTCITAKCGSTAGSIITNPDGSLNIPIVAAGVGALYLLTRRKG